MLETEPCRQFRRPPNHLAQIKLLAQYAKDINVRAFMHVPASLGTVQDHALKLLAQFGFQTFTVFT